MRSLGIYSFGRKKSERCPNKVLRPFGGTTLTDIVLSKLQKLGSSSFFAGYEEVFRQKCEAANVTFIQRDQRSALIDEPIVDILSFLKEVTYDYLLWINPCLPLLRVQTIKSFLDTCIADGYAPAFPVIRRGTHFIRADRKPVNFDPTVKTLNTKTVEPLYEMAHAFYFFNRQFFLDNETYWDWNEVRTVELKDKIELIDIDTEEDFSLAESLWEARAKCDRSERSVGT